MVCKSRSIKIPPGIDYVCRSQTIQVSLGKDDIDLADPKNRGPI